MKSLLQHIYSELLYAGKVKNQTDFGRQLGYNKSYISTLMNNEEAEIPEAFKSKMRKKFGISQTFLDSDGKVGGVFTAPGRPERISRASKEEETDRGEQREVREGENEYTLSLGEGREGLGRPGAIERPGRKIPLMGEVLAGTDQELDSTAVTYAGEYIDVGDLLRDSDAAFTVYGNSMNPNYPSGSVLGLKRNYDNFIQPGEIYVLQTKSNRIFKRLFYTEDKTRFICYSDNTMLFESGPLKGRYFYEPFEVPLEEVIRIFDVTGMIKRTRNSQIVDRIS